MRHNESDITDISLAAYLDNRLDAIDREAIERSLNGHSEWKDTIAAARSVLTDPQGLAESRFVPAYLIDAVVQAYPKKADMLDILLSLADSTLNIVKRSAYVTITYPFQPALVRRQSSRSTTMALITRTFEDIIVKLGVERMSDDRCNFNLSAVDVQGGVQLSNVRAELTTNDRELASVMLEKGGALFEDIKPGKYTIRLKRSGKLCGSLSIRIDQ